MIPLSKSESLVLGIVGTLAIVCALVLCTTAAWNASERSIVTQCRSAHVFTTLKGESFSCQPMPVIQ